MMLAKLKVYEHFIFFICNWFRAKTYKRRRDVYSIGHVENKLHDAGTKIEPFVRNHVGKFMSFNMKTQVSRLYITAGNMWD